METNRQQQVDPSVAQGVTAPSPVNPPPDDDSFYRKGVRLLYGIGGQRDPQRAIQYFREGYAKGDLNAGYMLADCLCFGYGVARDFDQSFRIASDLADKNFYPVYHLLSDAYTSGRGTAMDPDTGEAYRSKVLKYCSDPLPGVDESIRFEALLGTLSEKGEVDWHAVEKIALEYREKSDWPSRHGWLASALLKMDGDSTSPRPELMEVIEAGCAEDDVLSLFSKVTVQVSQEQLEEANKTLKDALRITPGYSYLCDFMLRIGANPNDDFDKLEREAWRACALGASVMRRGNDLGVKIEMEAPPFAGSWFVCRDDLAEKKEDFHPNGPFIILKNTNDKKLKGATIRLCCEDTKYDRTFDLEPIPPRGEVMLEMRNFEDIQFDEKLYVRVAKKNRYSEMALDTMQGLNDFRPSFMPLMMTWKSGTFGGHILQLKCLEGSLSNIVIIKDSGATASIPLLKENQEPVSVGWMEFSDGANLFPHEYFIVGCDHYEPILGTIESS